MICVFISDDTFSFYFNRCSVRSSALTCKASIRQAGGTYQPGLQPHIHQPAPGALHRVKMRKQVKRLSTRHLLKSGTAIAEDVMLNQHALQHAPKLESMARMANRKREQQRPKEPRSLQFDLKEQFVPDGKKEEIIFAYGTSNCLN